MRYILLSIWLALACCGTCQSYPPIQFGPYSGPTVVYPDTDINFELTALGSVAYDFLAAPTNANISTQPLERPEGYCAGVSWHTPARAANSFTNLFVVRATSGDVPPQTTTCTVSFVVIDLPSIYSITMSNRATVLQFTNPFSSSIQGFIEDQGFVIQRADSLMTTNWSNLAYVVSASPMVTFTDTNSFVGQRFYRLSASGWCYGIDVCP